MKIETNAIHPIQTKGSASVIYVAGSLGGGTATLGYVYEGALVSLKDETGSDITLESGKQYIVNHGHNMNLAIELSGSTAASALIKVKVLV